MYQIERQEQMLDYINTHKRASVTELSELFQVSKITVRADINEFVNRKLANKTHGGVVGIDVGISNEIPYLIKNEHNKKEKQIIGKLAAELIRDDSVIILDTGSTTFEVTRYLDKKVSAITNDIYLAQEICKSHAEIDLMMPGGSVLNSVFTLCGEETSEYFKNIHADILFLGCDAFDVNFGISDRSRATAKTKRAMIRAADTVVALADSSKFETKMLAKVCGPYEIDYLITDKIGSETRENLEGNGVMVITPKEECDK